MKARFFARFVLYVAAFALTFPSLYGQTTTGTITGSVKDATGAAIPGANVKVINPATGVARETSTNETGDYRVELLPPATYQVEVEKQGFQKATVSGVDLLVNQTRVVDVALQLGAVTQTVEVKASVGGIQTQTATLGQVVESKQVLDLPLNGRQFLQLAVLGPGVTPQPFANTKINFNDRSQIFFVSGENNATVIGGGQRQDSADFMIDGTDNRNPQAGAAGVLPSIEAVQEFKVLTNGFSPEFSRPTIVNIVTRSGGNEFHGDIFEFLRNDALDARNFFDDKKPPFRLNQFGGVLSGPIAIPGVYDGRNRTFFMANYEGRRIRKGNTFTGTFPTSAMRNGDFSGLPTIFDPTTLDPVTGTVQPFPSNLILPARFSRIYKNVLPFIPLPNVPGVGPIGLNFKSAPVDVRDFDQWTARIDHNISSKDSANVRYTLSNVRNTFPGIAPLYGARMRPKGRNLSIAETHIFSAAVVNQFHVGWQSTDNFRLADGNFGTISYAQDIIGLKNVSTIPANFGLPTFTVEGMTAVAGASSFTPQGGSYQSYEWADQLAILRGRHSFKIGGSVYRHRFDGIWDLAPRGIIQFNGFFTSDRKPTSPRVGFADFVLGDYTLGRVGTGNTQVFLRFNTYSGYLSDDIKITPKLTLNLGLRYDYTQPWKDEQNGENTYDLEVRRVILASRGEVRNGIVDPDFNNFAPRIGLAYRPFGEKTVFRAAYGIFYDNFEFNEIQFIRDNVPNLVFLALNNSLTNPDNMDKLFPSGEGAKSAFEPFGMNRHNRTPYLGEWNFTVERQLTPSTVLDVAYVGNKGTHLAGRWNPNQAFPDKDPLHPTSVDSRRPLGPGDLRLDFFDQNSVYHSLQVRAQRRLSGGLSFLAAYTHPRGLDACSRASCGHVNMRNLRGDRGLSDFNQADRASFSGSYQLPFGRGRHYLSSASGPLEHFVGGWQLNTIMTFSTGTMLTAGGGNSNTGGAQVDQRPNAVCNPNLSRGERTVLRYFNTSCLVRPQVGTFGNAGRNTIEGPGINDIDFSLFKTFRINEKHRIEFRAEFFNIFNHPSFVADSIGANVDSPNNFGRVTAALDGRDIQLGLKWIF